MTFAELKAEAASIVAAAKASGMILADEEPIREPAPIRKRTPKPRSWKRKNVHCKYCRAPIPNPAPLQVMCNDECRRLQRNLKQRGLNPPSTDKSRARYLARAEHQAAYHARNLADARSYRKLKGLPLRSPRSLLLEHAKAYRKMKNKKPRTTKKTTP